MPPEQRRDPWRPKEEGTFAFGAALWILARLRWPSAALGLDPVLFRELLRVRILLALRPSGSGSQALALAGVVIAVLATWLVGLGTGLVALLSKDAGVWVVTSQSALMVLVTVLLFQHFASILVDPTDIGVVASHPVEDRTLFAARLTEVGGLVAIFAASFTLGSAFLALFALPPLAVLLVFPVLSFLCAATALGLVACLFAACLRLVGPTHFQRVTLWAQILGGVLVFLAFQVPRLVHREQWGSLLDRHQGLRFLWPPFQYAEIFAWASGERELGAVPVLAAVLVPLAALMLTLWLASRYFVAGLQGTLGAPRPRATWERGPVADLLWQVGRRVSRPEERAGFEFTQALARREPQFLRAVLPQLLMFQVMGLGMGFSRHERGLFLPMSAGFLFMVLPNVLLQSQGTPDPDAREVFASAPLEDEAVLLRGGVKALLLAWIGLPSLVVLGVQVSIAGPGVLPRSLLALELAFAAALLFTRFFGLGVPFSQPIRTGATGTANLGIILLMGFALGILVLVHKLLSLHPLALGTGIVALAVLIFLSWRRLSSLRIAADRRTSPKRT